MSAATCTINIFIFIIESNFRIILLIYNFCFLVSIRYWIVRRNFLNTKKLSLPNPYYTLAIFVIQKIFFLNTEQRGKNNNIYHEKLDKINYLRLYKMKT